MKRTDTPPRLQMESTPLSASLTNDEIHARIFQAIVEQRLMPGTHLKEDLLCELFGIGRTRMRAVLARLAADHVVDLVANRGVFVCKPTAEEAQEVFRARCVIESHLVRRAAENPSPELRQALTGHLQREEAARNDGDQGAVITRCGNFHLLLAEQAHSPIMARFLRGLIARSSLIVAIYGVAPAAHCEIEEHRALTGLVLAGRAEEAAALMLRHLAGIEGRLDLQQRNSNDDPQLVLRRIFAAG